MHERLARFTSVNGNAIFISDTFLQQESQEAIAIGKHRSYIFLVRVFMNIKWIIIGSPSFHRFHLQFISNNKFLPRWDEDFNSSLVSQGNRNLIPRHQFQVTNVCTSVINRFSSRITRYNEWHVVIMTTCHRSIFVWRSEAIDLPSFLCHIVALIRLRAANYQTPPSQNKISCNLICTIPTPLTSFCISVLAKRKSTPLWHLSVKF